MRVGGGCVMISPLEGGNSYVFGGWVGGGHKLFEEGGIVIWGAM